MNLNGLKLLNIHKYLLDKVSDICIYFINLTLKYTIKICKMSLIFFKPT